MKKYLDYIKIYYNKSGARKILLYWFWDTNYALEEHQNIKVSSNFTNWKRKISCYEYLFLELLAVKINFFYRMLTKWRKTVFLKELDMVRILPDDKVLFIGCGILPTGAMIITDETKAKVITIDNNHRVVKTAQSYIQKKRLKDKIKIEYADGVNYPVKKFDYIFIAVNVWPIEAVLKHLHKNMKSDAKIICKGIKEDIVELFEKSKFKDMYSIENTAKNQKTYSYVLVKKDKDV